jgi:hypothetical protein
MKNNQNHGRLQEYSSAQATPIRVDVVKGILFDVLILGHNSRNRVDYPREVMQEAVGKYDGASVFVGHTRDGSNPDYDRKLGVIRNPRVAAEGIRGDLHFSPKHRLAEQLCWDATTNPQNLGLSHDADCTWTIGPNGRKQVTSINRVFIVDLVTNPATTHGLIEEEVAKHDDTEPVGDPQGAMVRSWELPYAQALREREAAVAVGANANSELFAGQSGNRDFFSK